MFWNIVEEVEADMGFNTQQFHRCGRLWLFRKVFTVRNNHFFI